MAKEKKVKENGVKIKQEKKVKEVVKDAKEAKEAVETSTTKIKQGIKDFQTEFIKAKGSGLTVQGKASRRIKGIVGALATRQWEADKTEALTFTKEFSDRSFTVQVDQKGESAKLTTEGKEVLFPLGKGAFKSVDYVLQAYGHAYRSASQVYEDCLSVAK